MYGMNPQRRGVWTDELVSFLTLRWAEGLSAREIATQIGNGFTRCAVLGKVNRLKLPLPEVAKERATTHGLGGNFRGTKHKRKAAKLTLKTPPQPQSNNAPELTADPIVPSELATKAFGTPCMLIELGPASCHWPINDGGPYLFCNATATEGYHYCLDHGRLAIQPARPR